MSINQQQITEARKVYELYWESYLKGDEQTFTTTLDEEVTGIWTAESEVFNNKAEVVSCVHATLDQVAGKTELRNRDVRLTAVDGLIQISEFTDLYLLIDGTWTFYAKLRLSTFMRFVAGEWKIYSQHASFPDHRTADGETFAPEQIKQENLQLREAVKRRTIELESKNRELGIEACLERVRTQAMAMRTPNELPGVCERLFLELRALGFSELRNAMINIHNDEKASFINYDYSDTLGQSITPLTFTTHPLIEKQIKQIRSAQDAFSETVFTGKELEDWKAFRKSRGEKDDPRIDSTSALYYYFYSIGIGSIGISTFGPVGEQKLELLKRFRNVFDFAYRRYLDVAQAEARVKEAQIEVSLERVRAVAMSMKKPAEMIEVCRVISDQLKLLNVANIRNIQTAIINEEKGTYLNYEYFTQYDTSSILEIVTKLHPVVEEFVQEIHKAADAFFTKSFSGDALKDWIAYRKQTNQNADPILEQATSVHYYFYSIGPGALGISTYAPLRDEELDLFKQFRNVFDLAYRRFIDIEQAEAQAREAQIEAALERVRSRTMAMHRSDELSEVSHVLFEQLKKLGEVGDQVSIALFDEERQVLILYATIYGSQLNRAAETGYDESPVIGRIYNAWKDGQRTAVFDLRDQELTAYLKFRAERASRAGQLLDSDLNRWVIHCAYFSKGVLSCSTQEPRPTEVLQLLERFAGVFELTYTRFLDLKQAEAQAREATIEAALERVRSKAMAMRDSGDLSAASGLVFTELRKLGITSVRCGVVLLSRESRQGSLYFTYSSSQSDTLAHVGVLNFTGHPSLIKQYDLWLKHEDYFVTLKNEELLAYYEWLYREVPIPFIPRKEDKQEEHGYYFYFSEGQFYAWTKERYSPEQLAVLGRFKGIIELTFRRYLDIQKAEAQAREAQIEASLERVRSKAMAMHKSDDLNAAVATVFEELDKLKLGMSRCGIGILSKEKRSADVWTTSKNEQGLVVNVSGDESMDIHPLLQGAFEAYLKQENFSYVLQGEDLTNYYRALGETNFRLPGAEEMATQAGTLKQYYYVATFASGGLFAFRDTDFTDEAKVVMNRFAAVFDLTYTRFQDLKKAEAQAKEAQIEASLERVRSRTLAMQKSDELAETAAVLFQQLIALGIAPNRLYIAIIKEENGETEFWITDEDGSKVSAGFAVNLKQNRTFQKMFEGWQLGKTSVTIDMQGEELQEYFRQLSSLNVPFKEGLSQTRRVQNIAYFSKGFLGIASPNEQPEETTTLLERFAAVFNLTFTRFNDLKLAEAQAHQAHLDLIQLQAEKKRAEEALSELRATQVQLLQQEKLASLGQLTAGIAHEIKNPLNFVNNFSSVSAELLDEISEEISKSPELQNGDVPQLLADVKTNLGKIIEHGTRADSIVKSMLQHSRGGSGKTEPIDLNALIKEYVNLAFHGMRAGKNPINVDIVLEFQESLGKVSVIAEDFSRVIINLCQNAFDAMRDKVNADDRKTGSMSYLPTLTVRTRRDANRVVIEIADNGPGIPESIKEKILQPFFTTKKGTQGTGLGLSITHDIVKAHGGEVTIETNTQGGATFVVALPADTQH